MSSLILDLSEHPMLPVFVETLRQLGGVVYMTEDMLNELERRRPMMTMTLADEDDPEKGLTVSLSFPGGETGGE